MPEDITLVDRSVQHALCVSETVGTMKLGKVMGPAYTAIMGYLEKQGIGFGEKDIPFTKYKNLDWNKIRKKGLFAKLNMIFFHKWEMDIGVPCPDSVSGEGKIIKTAACILLAQSPDFSVLYLDDLCQDIHQLCLPNSINCSMVFCALPSRIASSAARRHSFRSLEKPALYNPRAALAAVT